VTAFGFAGRGAIALAGAALAALYVFVLFPAASAKSGSPDNRVVDLQRSHRVDQFVAVLERWSAANPKAVGIMKRENILKLDSSFPAIYGVTLAFLYAWTTGHRTPTRLDTWLFVAPLLAAAFDYVENIFELYALEGIETLSNVTYAKDHGLFDARAILIQSISAHIKYVLLAVSIVGVAIAAAARVIRFVQHHAS